MATLEGNLNDLKSSLQFTCNAVDALGDDPPEGADKQDCCVTQYEMICFNRDAALLYPGFDLARCTDCPADLVSG